jgi:hypothetical protein
MITLTDDHIHQAAHGHDTVIAASSPQHACSLNQAMTFRKGQKLGNKWLDLKGQIVMRVS